MISLETERIWCNNSDCIKFMMQDILFGVDLPRVMPCPECGLTMTKVIEDFKISLEPSNAVLKMDEEGMKKLVRVFMLNGLTTDQITVILKELIETL